MIASRCLDDSVVARYYVSDEERADDTRTVAAVPVAVAAAIVNCAE